MQLLTTSRLLLISAALPVAGFGIVLAQALNPALPDWATPVMPKETVPALPPFYLELDTPLQLGLKGGRVQLSVNLAFSVRLGTGDLMDLSAQVKNLEGQVLSELSKDLFAASQKDQDLLRLRQVLPATFRDTVNKVLATGAVPAPVDEVLIMAITTTPN